MSTKTTDEPNPNSSQGETGEEESEGGLMPAILAGAGILAVVALLVFWPSGDDAASKDGKDGRTGSAANGAAGGGAGGAAGSAGAKGAGGVAARNADDPDRSGAVAAGPRRNPAIPPLEGMGLAPGVPPEEPPPKFKSLEQEIRWYEKKLVSATSNLETRTRAKERIPKLRAAAKDAENAEARLASLDGKEKIVNANFDRAQAKVDEIEAKLAELRGGGDAEPEGEAEPE